MALTGPSSRAQRGDTPTLRDPGRGGGGRTLTRNDARRQTILVQAEASLNTE